ncbi:hypothetical protein BDV96DRAFT_604646 [Lophiotrema nucula]|uniref:Uncharacterized protein n=1 Tax=Lophiotrema nucula TaxID=690887 RepID=A0A6A5YSQ6_9PLEO|nr:hypothetical protein BDV96DRAFT_604646 [Lophiotrema nucula]
MEALVAVGLAGNVVQFVQFSSSLVSEVQSIRKTGSPSSLPDLQNLCKTVVEQASTIRKFLTSSTNNLAKEEQDLVRVAEDCENAGNQFMEYLQSFTGTSSRFSFTKKLKTTVKFQFSHHRLEDFLVKLDRFRSTLLLGTTIFSRTTAEANHKEILKLLHTNEENLESRHKLEELAKEMRLYTESRLEKLISSIEDCVKKSNSGHKIEEIAKEIKLYTDSRLDNLDSSIEDCVKKLDSLCKEMPQTQRREQNVLNWLDFRRMTWRYEAVPLAYQETYEWIFRPPRDEDGWNCYRTYLERDNTLPYFINGKAGSGKSTLMKFIVEHPEADRALTRWAGPIHELLVLKFFFWDPGTALQKTIEGMLRALLHSALTSHAELIASLFPREFGHKWSSRIVEDLPGQPDIVEVRKAFDLLLKKTSNTLRIAIFIDGLDEFEGDHKEIAQWFRSIMSQHRHIKVIISSRPINAAIHVFRDCPNLNLHDLTKHDMKLFITGHLDAHDGMRTLSKHYPSEARDMIAEIRDKAQGVFLWVKLVVRLLLDGLEAGDDLSDLQRKLHSLPAGLREIYTRMFSRLNAEYKVEAAKIFQLMQTWHSTVPDPFTTATLYFALQPPAQALSKSGGIPDIRATNFFYENAEARIRTRCCGLLELRKWTTHPIEKTCILGEMQVNDAEDLNASTVDYLHRTVKEFLSSQDVWQEICGITQRSRFDPFESLISACVSVLRVDGERATARDQITAFYRQAEHLPPLNLRPYMDCLEWLMLPVSLESPQKVAGGPPSPWSTGSKRNVPMSDVVRPNGIESLQTFAAWAGLSKYLEDYYNRKANVSPNEQRSVLESAVSSWHQPHLSMTHRRETLLFILGHVVSPKEKEQIFQILAQTRRNILHEKEKPEEHAVLYAICILTGLPVGKVIGCTVRHGLESDNLSASSCMSFVHFYTLQNAELCPSRLRSLSSILKMSDDPENRTLGIRLERLSERLQTLERLDSERKQILGDQSVQDLRNQCMSLAKSLDMEINGVELLSQVAEQLLQCRLRLSAMSAGVKTDTMDKMYIADTEGQLSQIEAQVSQEIALTELLHKEREFLERLRDAYMSDMDNEGWILV